MRKRDTFDMLASFAAVVVDAIAVFCGFMLATWLRFDFGLIPIIHAPPDDYYKLYLIGAVFATLVFLLVFRSRGLYIRPQTGSFPTKIPRIMNGVFWGVLLTAVLAFSVQNEAEFSRLVIILAAVIVMMFVMLERWIIFRIEWNLARHSRRTNRVLILGTDSVAAHVMNTLRNEPLLRSRATCFLRTDDSPADSRIPADLVQGEIDQLHEVIRRNPVDQIILTDSRLEHDRIVDLIVLCEKNLMVFNMVPDLFRIMTSSMDVQTLEDIPLLGIGRWPLDFFWNRVLKRMEDVLGAVFGLILAAPVMLIAAIMIKRESAGPVIYKQERCGEDGNSFMLYKLRTMRVDAEMDSGPVFAVPDDARTTTVGAYLRRHNIDELPQLWNVLKGDMGLVGPRPERPHFVEQFREQFQRYMWRHIAKPGMTGWAQVNGLRGNTSIEERIKYDLYYLENWSLAFDFKILVRTIFAHQNAY